jgi:hydrogenase nickel incorporation protein HypA/HybF
VVGLVVERRFLVHEIAAMQGMVKTVLNSMQQAGASRVMNVELVLGASGHFTAEGAYQHFEVLTKGTPIEGASLMILWFPATFQCFSCLHRFESSDTVEQAGASLAGGGNSDTSALTCPNCGGVALEIEHQDVCYVNSIDVAYEEDVVAAAWKL